jgi:Putative phage abortive infection protein
MQPKEKRHKLSPKNWGRGILKWWRAYRAEMVIVVVGLAFVNAIFISKAFRQSTTVDPEAAGQLGSFVGGYFGAIFALIGIVLLYSTLKAQRLASALQNFETKYFELIKMHRDNVAEVEIQGVSGRKVFVLLLRELRCILGIVRQVAKISELELTKRDSLHIAYYCLFYGVGPNSSRMLKKSLFMFDSIFVDALEGELNKPEVKQKCKDDRKLGYLPFEGHQSRLGHYYRHLYQMIGYVDQQILDIDKYEYVKTIRAQLSTHEQALLLVNTLTPLGANWWRKDLILNYRLVQNIPQEFFDSSTELDATALFGPKYFEWQETNVKP